MPLPSLEHDIPGSYQLDALLRGRALQRAWHRARLDLVAHVLPPRPATLSLDVAAGAGILTWTFPEARLVSVDLRLEACRAIRRHTVGALTTVAELSELPFRTATFPQLYFLETLEHLTTKEGGRVLEELRRVATPGARCLITTPNYRSHWRLLERLLDTLRLTPAMAEGQHVSRYDRRTLHAAVESAGWHVRRLGSFNLAAPFAGLVSRATAARLIGLEADRAGASGALLYALCEARP